MEQLSAIKLSVQTTDIVFGAFLENMWQKVFLAQI